MRYACLSLIVPLGLAACAPQRTVQPRMPYPGELEPRQVVFVDDGRCPDGEVTQVTGGSNRIYATDVRKGGAQRDIRCVPR